MKNSIRTNHLGLLGLIAGLILLVIPGCGGFKDDAPRVIVVGIDGMDHGLTQKWMAQGLLPNLKALYKKNGGGIMHTSIPPESPIAWANFITGMNPGGHGIFDFLIPNWTENEDFIPVDAVAHTDPVNWMVEMFGYEIPLTGGGSSNKRRGTAFWEVLEDHSIPATIFKIPAHYPPTETEQKTLAGMGVPDLQGAYGVYFVYTDNEEYTISSDKISTGKVRAVSVLNNRINDFIFGPQNPAIAGDDKPDLTVPLTIDIDPDKPLVKITIGDEGGQEVILKEGEWSDFVTMDFEVIPLFASLSGMTRFYLKEVRPNFTLYCEPININPKIPAMELSTPSDWAAELADKYGYYYTKGMPEATKALEEGVLTYDEYFQQTMLVHNERKDIFFKMLDDHNSGFLFYYFCSTDLDSHMFWRCMDKNHPGYKPEYGHADFLKELYMDYDKVVGDALKKIKNDDVLIVMSDHGFAPFYRAFNLNTWLMENGYITLKEGGEGAKDYFADVDWKKTIAYNLGFAGIYINKKGGFAPDSKVAVKDQESVDRFVDEICNKLLRIKDPKNGKPVFLKMFKTKDVYIGDAQKDGPDIIVGANREYRVSTKSAMGFITKDILEDNLETWSGCHLMAPEVVPGILFSNKPIKMANPDLCDLPVSILKLYGIEKPSQMEGESIFE